MAESWPWFAPTLMLTVVLVVAARSARRRHQRLTADADRQHAQVLAGDARGVYGNYQPSVIEVERMNADEHWQAWLDRYGDDYATDEERRAAYQDFHANLSEIRSVFSQAEEMHTAGYLEAHERVASGDADSPADAELWIPDNINGLARADWLEGFRSHFEPRGL